MRKFFVLVATATFFIGSVAQADLDTFHVIDIDGEEGSGLGAFSGDITGSAPVTIWNNAAGGDDFWNEGDTGAFLYDSEKKSGNFTATVRAVGQTASIDGRWGKGGLMMRANLDGDSANAMPSVYTGNGSQITPPSAEIGNNVLDHSPVINRVNGRIANENVGGGFERAMNDAFGNAIDNNFAPTASPGTIGAPVNASWLRLHYQAPTAEAPNGTIIGAFAYDDNGSPGDWAYSDPMTDVEIGEDGFYVGLAYSAHNSLIPAEQIAVPGPDGGANPDGLHGITFDNYAFTNEYIEPVRTFRVGGNSIGSLGADAAISNITLGESETTPGLSTWWYDRNLRNNIVGEDAASPGFLVTAGYLENADGDLELDPGEFGRVVNPVGFHGGNNSGRVINGVSYPGYPEGSFTDADRNDYSTIARGQIWVPENGTYAIADGVDDFTMVAVDLNGEDGIEGIADLFDEDSGDPDAILAGNEVAILDDNWANWDGGGGNGAGNNYNDNLEFTNIADGGEWRDIEIWTSEGGGGDGGFVYFGKADEFVWDDERRDAVNADGNSDPIGFTEEERDMFVLGPDRIQTSGQAVVSADADAALLDGFSYIMQVGGAGSDQILIDDNDGVYTTTLDVSSATIDIVDEGGLATGAEIQLFDADNITGTPTLNFANPDDWDLSKLGQGILVFAGEGVSLCNPNTQGDLDGSGTVDFADFLALSGSFGLEVTSHEQGDIDCNGTVDFADFLALSGNFGNEVAQAQSVPEPSGLFLLGLASLTVGLFRRRRS